MTAPFPIKPPRDWENITTREAFSYVRTGENGDPSPSPPGPNATPDVDLTIADGESVTVMLAQPSGEEEYWPRSVWFDTRAFNQIRVVIDDVETAGYTTARILAKYKATVGGTLATPGAASAEVSAPITTTGPRKSGAWVALDPLAIGDRLWHAVAVGGDASESPVVGGIHFQFRQATAPRPATPPGDLPTGTPWGAVVFDANAASAGMAALYTDGADVNTFIDDIAANNLTTGATLLLPKYRTTAFGSGKPCIEWAGANVPLAAPVNPTTAYGSYTYYFVIDELDGGDGARIWGAGFGDSFQYSLYADGDTVYAANNNLFGSPSLFAEDSGGSAWGMAGAHLYRWVKDSASSSHHLFVDGVLKASAGAAPQTNNAGAVDFMNYLTGLGISGKIGRVVAYDQAHLSPTNTGPQANGLTVPELALQAFWGTP